MSRTAVSALSLALTLGAFTFGNQSRAAAMAPQDAAAHEHRTDRLQNVRLGVEYVDKDCYGEQVLLVKQLLNRHGAKPQLALTELFDDAAVRATKEFQRKHRDGEGKPLLVDGIIGRRTLAALEATPPPAVKMSSRTQSSSTPAAGEKQPLDDVFRQVRLLGPGDRGKDVLVIKEWLNNSGTVPRLKLDDSYSAATQRAVVAFQKSWNEERAALPELHLPVDGLVRSRTARALQEKGEGSMLGSAAALVGDALRGKRSGGTAPADHETFQNALKLILLFEGGVSRDKHDNGNRGGNCTNQGITQVTYDRYRDMHKASRRSVEKMSTGERDQIYYQLYWKAARCDELPANLAVLCFNTAVNMGTGANARLLRTAAGISPGPSVTDKTIEAVREFDSVSLSEHYAALVEMRYQQIAEIGNNERYLKGWLRRLERTRVAAGIKGTLEPMMALSTPLPGEDFGPPVSEGIMQAQRALGLPVTGELDMRTQAALEKRTEHLRRP